MGSWQIATVRGIPLRIHWTFLLLPLWYAGQGLLAGDAAGAVRMVVLILLLFACVTLHELGHSLAAQRYGIATHEILLLPIGGLARLSSIPRRARQELVIALAGPAVNIFIALALFVLILILGRTFPGFAGTAPAELSEQLLTLNVFLALFNLIPAFPLDGGRVLRALAGLVTSYERATALAVWVGRILAGLFVIVGFVQTNWSLILIGIFIFFGGTGEYAMVQAESRIARLSTADVTRPTRLLHPLDLLGMLSGLLNSEAQPIYPIIDGEAVVGVVTPEAIWQGLMQQGPAAPVTTVMDTNLPLVSFDWPITQLYEWLAQQNARAALVVRQGKLLGFVRREDVERLIGG